MAALLLAALYLAAGLLLFPGPATDVSFGICLPSPNLWDAGYPSSWILNAVLILAGVPLLLFCNKHFNFVAGTGMVLPMVYAVLECSNPFLTSGLCSSTVIMAVNFICLWVLFSTYGKPNATQDYFLIATLLSLGSMVQYGFIPFIAVYIAGGIVLKSLRFKEAMAMLLGLVAPYWVGIGLGLLPLYSFRLPYLSNLFQGLAGTPDFLVMLLGLAIIFVVSALLSLNNAVKLWAGNSRIRRLNNAINIMGYVSALCMLVDFNNMMAYAGTLALWASVQTANLFALYRIRRPALLLWIMSLFPTGFLIWMLALALKF